MESLLSDWPQILSQFSLIRGLGSASRRPAVVRVLQLCCVLCAWLCKGMCVRMSWTHCFLIVALVHLFRTTCLGSAGALAARWQTARPHTALQYHRRKCSHKNTYINIRIQYWKHSHKRHLTQSQHGKHTHWPHNAGSLVLLILAS